MFFLEKEVLSVRRWLSHFVSAGWQWHPAVLLGAPLTHVAAPNVTPYVLL